MNKPHIVVLGAGYGGLMTVTRLQKKFGVNDVTITLINKNNKHYEATWLHESAAGTLKDERVQYPVEQVVNTKKVNFVQDTVVKINADKKSVLLESGEIDYDYLVVALGFESETFGIPGLKEHALAISNVSSAKKVREHIENQFSSYKENEKELLTIVVGGGGFTGIEFLGELTNRVPELCKKYDVKRENVKIVCIESAPSILPGFAPSLVEFAVKYLEGNGVEFKLGTAIKEATPEGVKVAKGEEVEFINANSIVWAAGVRGSHIIDDSGFESNRGKIMVDEYLRVPNNKSIFVIGDCSLFINKDTNRPFPPTAQIAMQHGELVAKNLYKLIKGDKNLTKFKFSNKGTVCSLGDHNGIGVAFGVKIKGYPASILKKIVDDRALLLIGGLPLLMKKGKFNFL